MKSTSLSQSLCLAIALPILPLVALVSGVALAESPTLAANKSAQVQAATKSSLSQEMEDLGGGDKLAGARERMYIVQDRSVGLGGRFEVSAGVAKNFNSNIYIDSTENSLLLTYHFSDRWYSSVYGAQVYNELTKSGEDAWEDDGLYPNTAFVKRRYDATVGFNLIYGKARVTQDAMFYFDQYVALGGGMVEQSDGLETLRVPSTVADVGFALWFGRRLSLRLGVKDHYFEEHRPVDTSRVHHVLGYSSIGFMLGGAG